MVCQPVFKPNLQIRPDFKGIKTVGYEYPPLVAVIDLQIRPDFKGIKTDMILSSKIYLYLVYLQIRPDFKGIKTSYLCIP